MPWFNVGDLVQEWDRAHFPNATVYVVEDTWYNSASSERLLLTQYCGNVAVGGINGACPEDYVKLGRLSIEEMLTHPNANVRKAACEQ